MSLTDTYSSLDTIRKSSNVSLLLSHSFADAIRSNAFLYTAYKERMTGIRWIYVGTDWNTMQTYAGLSEEFRQPVMEGMVGVSPFVGNMNPFVEAFNVRE